jgi:hypothetical protein
LRWYWAATAGPASGDFGTGHRREPIEPVLDVDQGSRTELDCLEMALA